MSNDPADAAAKALVSYWRREEMDATKRLISGRLEKALDAGTRAELSAAARADPAASVQRIAAALRDAAASDWTTGSLLRALAPASAGVEVHVVGDGNHTTVAGGDVIIGGTYRRVDEDEPKRDVVMVVAADPSDLAPLQLPLELRGIQERIRFGILRERWKVSMWLAARLVDLTQGLLDDRPRILHFSGHGSEKKGVFLQDPDGFSRPVSRERLRGLFQALPNKPECVVLNSCFSESQACEISREIAYVIGT